MSSEPTPLSKDPCLGASFWRSPSQKSQIQFKFCVCSLKEMFEISNEHGNQNLKFLQILCLLVHKSVRIFRTNAAKFMSAHQCPATHSKSSKIEASRCFREGFGSSVAWSQSAKRRKALVAMSTSRDCSRVLKPLLYNFVW